MKEVWKWLAALGAGAGLAALNAILNSLGVLQAQLPENDGGMLLGVGLIFVVRAVNWAIGKLGGASDGPSAPAFR